jgi:hypothetical protein
MISYASLKDKLGVFQSFTGLTLTAFERLLPAFAQAYEADLDQRDQQRGQARQRQRGGGRIGALPTPEDKLVFILFYFKFYPVQVVQGYCFGLGQPQANDWIHRLTPLLRQALGEDRQLPARQTKDIAQVLAACPGLTFILDGTERPIRRPKNPDQQRHFYSGKKKRHTVKNNLVTDQRTGKIKVLSPTVEGKKHDKKLAEEDDIPFPEDSTLYQDTGFIGYQPQRVQIIQPKKKPKGGQLTAQEKSDNTAIAKARIGIEHAIGAVKIYHIVHDVFRNLRLGFDDTVMEIACGLHNLRLDYPLRSQA